MKTLYLFIISLGIITSASAQNMEKIISQSINFQNNDHKPVVFKDKAYFSYSMGTYTSTGENGYATLATSDGSKQGTNQFMTAYNPAINGKSEDFLKLPYSNPQFSSNNFQAFTTSKFMFFMAKKGSFLQTTFSLWSTDGSKNNTKEISSKITNINKGLSINDNFYFIGNEGNSSQNLYTSDGSEAGTKMIKKNISDFYEYDNKLYFIGLDNESVLQDDLYTWNSVFELNADNTFKSLIKNAFTIKGSSLKIQDDEKIILQGSEKGSSKLRLIAIELKNKNIKTLLEFQSDFNDKNIGSNGYDNFIKLKNNYVLMKSNLKQQEGSPLLLSTTSLLTLDLTLNNLKVEIPNFKPNPIGSLRRKFVLNQKLYFEGGNDIENPTGDNIFLWETDGTKTGTRKVIQLKRVNGVPNGQANVKSEEAFIINNKAYFFGDSTYNIKSTSSSAEIVNKYFLYQSDGTLEGTKIISDSLAQPSNLVQLGSKMYFTDWNYIYETEGTKNSTKKLFRLTTNFDIGTTTTTTFDRPALSEELAITLGTLNIINQKIILPYSLRFGGTGYYSFDPSSAPKNCNVGIVPDINYKDGRIENQYNLCSNENQKLVIPYITLPQSTLKWYKDGNIINNYTKNELTVSENGKYKVEASYKGCISTSKEISITLNQPIVTLSKVKRNPTPTSSEEWLNLKITNGFIFTNLDRYTYYLNLDEKLIKFEAGEIPLNVINGKDIYKPTATENGIFSIKVEDANKCATNASLDWKTGVQSGGGNNGGTTNPNLTAVISTTSPTTVNAPTTVKLTADIGQGYTYQWQKDGVNITGATSATFEAKETGTYRVVISLSGASKTSNEIKVTINSVALNVTISSPITETNLPNTIILTAQTGTGYTYQWQKDGVNIPNANLSTYEAKESGVYRVVVSLNGVSKTSNELKITISSILANEPIVSPEITIFPNPSFENVTIKLNSNDLKPIKISIYSQIGRFIKAYEIQKTELRLDVSDFTKGMYLIKIEQELRSYSAKFIKY